MAFTNRIRRLSQMIADSITGAVITGGTIQTALAPAARWVLSSGPSANTIKGYTGNVNETTPAALTIASSPVDFLYTLLTSPLISAAQSLLELSASGFSGTSKALLRADDIQIGDLSGNATLLLGAYSTPFKGCTLKTGTAVVTAAITGDAVIAHGLPTTPDIAIPSVIGTSSYAASILTIGPTNVTVRVRKIDGVAATANVPVHVLVVEL